MIVCSCLPIKIKCIIRITKITIIKHVTAYHCPCASRKQFQHNKRFHLKWNRRDTRTRGAAGESKIEGEREKKRQTFNINKYIYQKRRRRRKKWNNPQTQSRMISTENYLILSARFVQCTPYYIYQSYIFFKQIYALGWSLYLVNFREPFLAQCIFGVYVCEEKKSPRPSVRFQRFSFYGNIRLKEHSKPMILLSFG